MAVDRESLLSQLKTWMMSRDEATWRPAAEIIWQIAGADVVALRETLRHSGDLAAEKKRVLESNLRTNDQ